MAFFIRRQLPGGPVGPAEFSHQGNGPAIVTFGSDPSSQIRVDVTDPNERVRSRHCTLVYTGAGFRIDFERDTRVFIDQSTEPVIGLSDPFHQSGNQPEIKLRLGMPVAAADGPGAGASRNPVFHIHRNDPGAKELEESRKWRNETNDPIENVKRNRTATRNQRWFISLLAIALIAVAVTTAFSIRTIDARSRWMENISTELSPSIGVIGVVEVENGKAVSFVPMGTGWLCCANAGKAGEDPFVVTNGHVWSAASQAAVRMSDQIRASTGAATTASDPSGPHSGARIVIRFPERPGSVAREAKLQDIDATTTPRQHALYTKFGAYLTGKQLNDAAPNMYDAYAIKVPADDPAVRGRARLPLAQARSAPRSAEPVAAVGYPVENLPYAVNFDSPVPKIFPSSIVRRTSPFLGPPTPGVPSLLTLPAESAGGLSGSPVIAGDDGNYRVVGLVMQASLATSRPSAPAADPGKALQDASASEPAKRFATSNLVFATDSETVLELFEGVAPRLDPTRPDSTWDLARESRFHDPIEASYTALQQACHPASSNSGPPIFLAPKEKPITAELSGAGPSYQKADKAAARELKRLGSYRRTETYKANEFFWVAAAYEKPLDAPLELEVRQSGGDSAPISSDAFMVVPGFSSYLWTGSPQGGTFEIAVRGQRGSRVKFYVEHCMRDS